MKTNIDRLNPVSMPNLDTIVCEGGIKLERRLDGFSVRLRITVETESGTVKIHDCEFSDEDKDSWLKLERRENSYRNLKMECSRKGVLEQVRKLGLFTIETPTRKA